MPIQGMMRDGDIAFVGPGAKKIDALVTPILKRNLLDAH
jgi:hypothetical protein